MSKKLNLSGMLDFTEIDLTAPDKVVEEILAQLPEDTQSIIFGSIVAYDGQVTSYTTTRTSLAEAIGTITTEKRVNIQDSLGKRGEEDKKFECFLYTSGYTKYKYRMFFMKYGIANYPVQFTLEEDGSLLDTAAAEGAHQENGSVSSADLKQASLFDD